MMRRYRLIDHFKEIVRLEIFRKKFCKYFPDNDVLPMNVFDKDLISIGKYTYGELKVITFNNKSHLTIGAYCSIAQNVTFLLDVEHNYKAFSTYPFNAKLFDGGDEAFSKGDIIIDDDVWIGYGATIMSGVHIGKGAIVASNALVTGDIPPYAIYGGIPAKIIKYRFDKEIIDELMKIDYSKLPIQIFRKNIDKIYIPIENMEQLDWIRERNSK